MKEILQKYETFLRRKGLLPRSLEYYMWHIKKFFDYTDCNILDFGNKKLFQKRYDQIIIKKSLCNESKKKHLKCARIFADFLVEEEFIGENAPRQIKPPRVQTSLPIPIENNEIYDIFVAIKKRWSGSLAYRNEIIIRTFLNTGLRRSELTSLKRYDVHKDHIVVRCGKGHKDRIVYISSEFSPILRNYIKTTDGVSEYVFFSLRSQKISLRAMSRIFEEIKKEANLERLHAHKMRHTYASRVLESGISLAVLRDQLGHTNITTTNRYIAVRNQHRKESMERFAIM